MFSGLNAKITELKDAMKVNENINNNQYY